MRSLQEISPAADKADKQREAATEAADLLAERLGPDLARFADLFDRASFRFRAALFARLSDAPLSLECQWWWGWTRSFLAQSIRPWPRR